MKRAQVLYVQALSGYEFVALATGKVPPLIRIAWRYRRTPVGFAVIGAHILWLSWHLLLEAEN